MRIGIVGSGKENKAVVREFKKVFKETVYIPVDEIIVGVGSDGFHARFNGMNLFTFDCILPLPTPEKKEFYYVLIKILEREVYVPITSENFFLLWNKPLLSRLLLKHRISARKTFAIAQNVAANVILKKLKLPVIVTPPSGKRVLVTKEETLKDVLSLFKPGYMILVEKPIKPLSVIRVFVAGSETVAYEKIENSTRAITLPKDVKELALKVRDLISSDFCCINFLKTKKGVMVNEISLSPDFDTFQEVTGKNIALMLATFIKEKMKRKSVVNKIIDGIIVDPLVSLIRWVENEVGNLRSAKPRV